MSAKAWARDGSTKSQTVKKYWNECSPLAQQITTALKEKDFLQIPVHQQGWGLAAFLKVDVAEAIDEILKEEKAILPGNRAAHHL